MGNLLRVLYAKNDEKIDIFVDFENVQPTEAEMTTWQKINPIVSQMCNVLEELSSYKGAVNEIREAISSQNNEESLRNAWKAICPIVNQLKQYYEFSLILQEILKELLSVLCSSEMTARQHLEAQQALFKQFAEIIHFAVKFDDLKVNNPSIQNDFSFYRRTTSKMQGLEDDENKIDISHELASKMSFFYAQSTPMLQVIVATTSGFITQKGSVLDNITECLSIMANVCRSMVEQPAYRSKFVNYDTIMFCLRVMVGAIILYDHVSRAGVFSKGSSIDVKSCIKLLKSESANVNESKNENANQIESLLNALRYNSKHLTEESTPKAVKQMLN